MTDFYDDYFKQIAENMQRVIEPFGKMAELNNYMTNVANAMALLADSIQTPDCVGAASNIAERISSVFVEVPAMQKIIDVANSSAVATALQVYQANTSVINQCMQGCEVLLPQWNVISKVINASRIAMPQYDFGRLMDAIQDSLSSKSQQEKITVDDLADEVTQKYIVTSMDEEQKEINHEPSAIKYNMVKEVRDWISFLLAVISFIFMIHDRVSTKFTVTCNTIAQINNYYTIDLDINADILNALSYRIITQDNVMPRVRPDCHSRVTGHLNIGQVVTVIRKYRKWILIEWKNENGDECIGWIQNYKVTEFR